MNRLPPTTKIEDVPAERCSMLNFTDFRAPIPPAANSLRALAARRLTRRVLERPSTRPGVSKTTSGR